MAWAGKPWGDKDEDVRKGQVSDWRSQGLARLCDRPAFGRAGEAGAQQAPANLSVCGVCPLKDSNNITTR